MTHVASDYSAMARYYDTIMLAGEHDYASIVDSIVHHVEGGLQPPAPGASSARVLLGR